MAKIKAALASHPDMQFTLFPETYQDGFTQSEMTMMDNCPEKWYLRYNERLEPKGLKSWHLIYGDWMHDFWEEFYTTKGQRYPQEFHLHPDDQRLVITRDQQRQQEYWQGVAKILSQDYAGFYRSDHKFLQPLQNGIENVAEYEYRGILLTGKLDLEFYDAGLSKDKDKGYFVMDHKTSMRIDKLMLAGWEFRFQFMFYCWLSWKIRQLKVRGYYYNVQRKPGLKLGVDETIAAHLQRIRMDVAKNEQTYYFRERKLLTKDALLHFERTILDPKINRLRMMMDPKTPDSVKSFLMRNKNTEHCTMYGKTCPYMSCCSHSLSLERHGFTRRKVKHEELVERASLDN